MDADIKAEGTRTQVPRTTAQTAEREALREVHHRLRDECFVLANPPWPAALHRGHPLRQLYQSATNAREGGQ